ncbi:MAG: L,D-transpeptidase family protein [Bacteroidia bacterium]|nr:L,D-transpeptidase family protein [Bacteroidia bacterium]MCF8448134.1 L,D-transpeptidase family protein [Bacteroidia bacterium]
MKLIFSLLLFFISPSSSLVQTDFLKEQLKFERVRNAKKEKELEIQKSLAKLGLTSSNVNLIFIAYKDQDLLEIYAKKKSESKYKILTSYPICARSGILGPKRKQGDGQVPEGFYFIDRFNPASSYYLSLGINYPNQADKLKSISNNLGGDIFIHGYCATIGCLPMTNEKIKEIYLLAIYAKNNGQNKIPVYIFPFKMSQENMAIYLEKYKSNKALINFWLNLKTGYDKFLNSKTELKICADKKGNYLFLN